MKSLRICPHCGTELLSDEAAGQCPKCMLSIGLENGSELTTGWTVSRYRILRKLGQGGMGEVYLAEDPQLGRKVALKLLPEEYTGDPERMQRFKQEARAASALVHPNIITIYEIGESDGVHYIAEEYVEGQTLRRRVEKGPIELREALEIAIQIAGGLGAAHDAGILHRDLKPENVMIRDDGYLKILDFGLAKLSEASGSALTETKFPDTEPGRIMGTPRYMSPEQVLGQELDAQSDIFSLGVVLYEMVAGRPPFFSANRNEVLVAIVEREPPPLARFARNIPKELERIAGKALAKRRAERFQIMKEMLIDLRNLRLELEVEARMKRAGDRESKIPSGDEELREATPSPPRLWTSEAVSSVPSKKELEPIGGAVSLDSGFYIQRSTDVEFTAALARRDSIVLVKGPRQVGKTSLLARALHKCRRDGVRVLLTDFQKLSSEQIQSPNAFYLALAEMMAGQLDLEIMPHDVWDARRGPGINFERFMRREVLSKTPGGIVWGMDEVDRLFTCQFGSEVFGLFRSWHNERSLDPAGPWRGLTLAMAYATEAHLFITDMNQSPFNVGTRLHLEDFTFEQVTELNHRYDSPLRDESEVARYFRLVGGHPYLVRRGLHEMAAHGLTLVLLESKADDDEGPFGDHLRRILVLLAQDTELQDIVRELLRGHPCSNSDAFYRLRSAGLMVGDSPRDLRPRCQLYANYLEKRLL